MRGALAKSLQYASYLTPPSYSPGSRAGLLQNKSPPRYALEHGREGSRRGVLGYSTAGAQVCSGIAGSIVGLAAVFVGYVSYVEFERKPLRPGGRFPKHSTRDSRKHTQGGNNFLVFVPLSRGLIFYENGRRAKRFS